MSVIIYTCDTCNRDLELVENDSALSLVDNCIITQQCKGSLYKTGRRANGVIGRSPDIVEGLDDYDQQQRLYVHEQTLPSSSWSIVHNLNTNPIVYVYIKAINNEFTQLEADDYVATNTDVNSTTIEFADNNIGIVHVVSRPNIDQPTPTIENVVTAQLSANTILTIASPILESDNSVESYTMAFASPSTSITSQHVVDFIAHKKDDDIALFNTPWGDVQLITWNDQLYRVRSVRITNIINANGIENGSPFYFVDNPNVIMLSSNSPQESITDIDNKVVVVRNLPQNAFTRNRIEGTELVVETSNLVDIFPKLEVFKTIFE